jgi:hypothetical protein
MKQRLVSNLFLYEPNTCLITDAKVVKKDKVVTSSNPGERTTSFH